MKNKKITLTNMDNEEIEINKFPFIIGSFPTQCDLVLDNSDISPLHCQIINNGEVIEISDFNSRLGTSVNGNLVNPGNNLSLNNQDKIILGDVVLTINIEEVEFISPSEFNSLNSEFQKIIEDDYNKEAIAKQIINQLWDKIILVKNSASDFENEYLLNEFISNLYDFKETIEIDVKKSHTEELEKLIEDDIFSTVPSPDETRTVDFNEEPKETGSRKINIPKKPANTGTRKISIPKREEIKPSMKLKDVSDFSVIEIDHFPFSIGRDDSNDFQLSKRGVSRIHASILYDKARNEYLLRDNNALNGTYVNGERIVNSVATINPGDTISLFEYEFIVE